MALSPFLPRCLDSGRPMVAVVALLLGALPLPAGLLDNLQSFPDRIAVGDPNLLAADGKEGPKGITSADFNRDGRPDLAVGNLDGTITVLLSLGGGRFGAPRHVRTGAKELRSVLAADLNGDGQPDLAAASPQDGQLMIFFNAGGGSFAAKTPLPGWVGVRSVASGDFDGDGIADLAAAGPGIGVRHLRGTGGGAFEIMGDLKQLSPRFQNLSATRPVYSMRTLRSRDGLRDELLVTHADSPSLWVLSTVPVDRGTEPPVDPATLPAWGANPSPVLITEVQVQNADTLLDSDGTAQPWVELLNKSAAPVNLAGWRLAIQSQFWTFPSVTVPAGRFLIVFLSAKNRTTGPELHTSFVLKENLRELTLLQPDGFPANTIDLPSHALSGISRGLSPGHDEVRWFDLPSPGVENNAGESNLEDISGTVKSTLTITPPSPGPGQSVTVRVTTPGKPTGSSSVRNVWFSATPGLTEVHHLMHRTAPGVFQEVLPPGSFTGTTPHRVLARLRDGNSNDYTVEIHPGLDEPESGTAVAPRPGCLLPVASTPSPKVKSFDVGPVLQRAVHLGAPTGAPTDLVYADLANGLIRVHRGSSSARRFEPMPAHELKLGDAPRDVKLADTNGDGWLEATVVLELRDLAVTCRNEAGTLVATGELSTGRSPREAVMADFTGDGRPDAAVINRVSADISILASAENAAGLVSLDQIYSVDGDVACLMVRDFNKDGHADVLQLHRASGELSVRQSGPDGRLGAPVFWPLGAQGSCAAALADVNNDGRWDVVTANLGRERDGSISVVLGREGGGFEPPRVFNGGASLFAISVADFDLDGNQDVVAGQWDCRVRFFMGDGRGNFNDTYGLPVPFVNESRTMVTRDFDNDGDIDIAGAGYEGDMVTLENRGAATAKSWVWHRYPPPVANVDYAANRIGLTVVDDDPDPDLLIGTARGLILYQGLPGPWFKFVPQDLSAPGLNYAVDDVFTADLDGDNVLDMVAACRAAACVTILSQTPDGLFSPRLQVDVPPTRHLATGDLDGDGKPDLVGTGHVLWTVLSSRPPQIAPPDSHVTNRPQSNDIVINEVLALNRGVPVAVDSGQKSDYVELFNGTGSSADLTGWKVRVQSSQNGTPFDKRWTLPSTTVPAKGRTVVIFSADAAPPGPGSPHAGFALPAEGGTLTLLKPDDTRADKVIYPRAQENVSWSRYHDGHPSFHADRIPSPGSSNVDNGTVPPEVELTPPSPASLRPGQPIRFTARGRDDLGIVAMTLIWNRLDAPLATPQRLNLYDNGEHDDGEAGDGLFAEKLAAGLPAGAEVQFYLEAVDLDGEVLRLPETAELSAPGNPPVAWSFVIADPPTLEISEVCTDNVALQRDESGGHPDYVKVRNTGPASVDLSRILLAKSPLSESAAVFAFPSGLVLPPGGETTVFADGDPAEGPLHAPFTFDAGGDDVSLLAVMPSGARQWIHSVSVPATAADSKYVRLPGTDLHAVETVTEDLDTWSGTAWEEDGAAFSAVRFPTLVDATYRIEGDAPGPPEAWSLLETVTGDGSVMTVKYPVAAMAAVRAVADPLAPAIRVDAAIGSVEGTMGTAGIYGEARGVTALTLYFGKSDGDTTPGAWSGLLGGDTVRASSVVPFSWLLKAVPDTLYYYRVRAEIPGGGVIWSPPGTTFRTLKAGAGAATSLFLTRLYPTGARIQTRLSWPVPPGSSVTLLVGTADAFGEVRAWPRQVEASRDPLSGGADAWTADLVGLARETDYVVRAVVTAPSGQAVSAPRLMFRTPNPQENLARNLVPSEVMYNPPSPTLAEEAAGFETDDFEFIEWQNTSDESVDLSGLWLTGIDFDFPQSGAPILPPGGFAVIAANPHAFAMRYGTGIPLAGWTLHPFRDGRLSNGGESVALSAADGALLVQMVYSDFPASTDGGGYSLEYRPLASVPIWSSGYSYYPNNAYEASRRAGGSPGWDGDPSKQTYAQWQAFYFTASQRADTLISGMTSDPDRDGLGNFGEYACGTRPLVADARDLLLIRDGSRFLGEKRLLITFPANQVAKDAVITLEGTDGSLTTWSPDVVFSPASPVGYSQGVCLSRYQGTNYVSAYNSLVSAIPVASTGGSQVWVTIAILPVKTTVIDATGHSVTLAEMESRLFRLKFSQP